LLRCKGVESDRRIIMTPIVVVISTSLWRSLRRRPFDRRGLQETSKESNRPAVSVFIMAVDVLVVVVVVVLMPMPVIMIMSVLVVFIPLSRVAAMPFHSLRGPGVMLYSQSRAHRIGCLKI